MISGVRTTKNGSAGLDIKKSNFIAMGLILGTRGGYKEIQLKEEIKEGN